MINATPSVEIEAQKDCILCSSCASLAPDNFDVNNDSAMVVKQPAGGDEVEQCREARDNCPMNIIVFAG